MTLQVLPTETILQILCFVSPHDIGNIQLVSRQFSYIVKSHEQFLCAAITEVQGLGNCRALASSTLSRTDTHSLPEMRILSMQWDRKQLIERLLPAFSKEEDARDELELLWDYQSALQYDFKDCGVNGHRTFIRSTTLEDLNVLMTAIRNCVDFISKALIISRYGSRRMEWFDEPCALIRRNEWNIDVFSEVILAKGFEFVVKAVIERSHAALDELKGWQQPSGKTLTSRLDEERRWKSKIASLQANARC